MKPEDKAALAARKAAMDARLDPAWQPVEARPILGRANVEYEVAARTNAIPCGGVGLMAELARATGLAAAIDEHVRLFKVHKPYHESDHVLSMAFNVLCGGTCLEDIALLRDNVSYLDAVGAHRVPDQTTAGDFLRRFKTQEQVDALQEAINVARRRVWRRLPRAERRLALIDVDGTVAPTWGEKKEGMDISYKGTWGYHPLVVSLANTQEVLYTRNRPGNRPSHDGAVAELEAAVALVKEGGFAHARLRGDTDFSFTGSFDRWTAAGTEFVFGIDAHPTFVARADALAAAAWKPLLWTAEAREGPPRTHRENVKDVVVRERGFTTLTTEREDYAEFAYRPGKSERDYRMVAVRKTIRVTEGQRRLADEIRYFFYVTNVPKRTLAAQQVIGEAHARCHQENVIEQLKNGVRAMRMPSDTLLANGAYLVIAALAWNLKAWLSIVAPQSPQTRAVRRMEFRRFLNSVMLIPTQVVKTGRRVVLRLLAWTSSAQLLIDGLTFFKRARLA